jgi:hypothetical protein
VAQVNVSSSAGHCELYVKSGENPTLKDFQYVDTDSPSEVIIPNPVGETWYFGIFGKKACSYIFEVGLSVQKSRKKFKESKSFFPFSSFFFFFLG